MSFGWVSPSTPRIVGAISCKRPIPPQFVARIVHQNQRHRIGRVIRVRARGDRIDHHLGVAVVGGDDPAAVLFFEALPDAPQTGVHRFDGANGRLHLARVAHHIGVGEVHHDDVEILLAHRIHHDVRDAVRAHLRLQIVGRDLRRRHHFALFAARKASPCHR